MKKNYALSLFLSMFLSLLMQSNVLAADKEAMARAQYMIRQITAEKNQLTVNNQKLLAEKKELEKKLESLQKKSESKKTAMSGKIKGIRKQLKQERNQHAETRDKLDLISSENDRLFNLALEQTHTIDICVSNNKKLYEVNKEILGQYEDKGIWNVITQAEPVMGLTRVQIENFVDDYQYRLDDLRVEPKDNNKQASLIQ